MITENLTYSDYVIERTERSQIDPRKEHMLEIGVHCPACSNGGAKIEHGEKRSCEYCGLNMERLGNALFALKQRRKQKMTDDYTDEVLTDDEYVETGLIPVGPPSFGWYHVRSTWVTPPEEIESRVSEKTGKKYCKVRVGFRVFERAVYAPDPNKAENATLSEITKARGSFYRDVFIGSENEMLHAMGTKLDRPRTPERIHGIFKDNECWVQLYHGKNFRDQPEEKVSKWRSSAPEETFVHPEHQKAFRGE